MPFSLAPGPYPAPVQFHQVPGQGQPQSGALISAARRPVNLHENIEDPLQVLVSDAYSPIVDRDLDVRPVNAHTSLILEPCGFGRFTAPFSGHLRQVVHEPVPLERVLPGESHGSVGFEIPLDEVQGPVHPQRA